MGSTVSGNKGAYIPTIKGQSKLVGEERVVSRSYSSFGRSSYELPTKGMLHYMIANIFEYLNREEGKSGAIENGLMNRQLTGDEFQSFLEYVKLAQKEDKSNGDFEKFILERNRILTNAKNFNENDWEENSAMILKKDDFSVKNIKDSPKMIWNYIHEDVYMLSTKSLAGTYQKDKYQRIIENLKVELERMFNSKEQGPIVVARLLGYRNSDSNIFVQIKN